MFECEAVVKELLAKDSRMFFTGKPNPVRRP